MNYNNYPQIGVDSKIYNIQNLLNENLGLQDVDFYGRVQKSITNDGKFVPEFHLNNSERKEVYYNDQIAKGGNVFFIDSDKHTVTQGGLFVSKIKIVFMLNLNLCYDLKDYKADTEVQDICVKLIQKSKMLEITELEKGLKNVFNGFDISKIKFNDMNPYHIFSINGNLKYLFNCNHL